jgi:hypothetical protein
MSDAAVCGDEIINVDDSEAASVRRLRWLTVSLEEAACLSERWPSLYRLAAERYRFAPRLSADWPRHELLSGLLER